MLFEWHLKQRLGGVALRRGLGAAWLGDHPAHGLPSVVQCGGRHGQPALHLNMIKRDIAQMYIIYI